MNPQNNNQSAGVPPVGAQPVPPQVPTVPPAVQQQPVAQQPAYQDPTQQYPAQQFQQPMQQYQQTPQQYQQPMMPQSKSSQMVQRTVEVAGAVGIVASVLTTLKSFFARR